MNAHTLKTRSEAYTLLEVLVVVVLMGLLAAAFVPSLAATSDKAEREQLISELVQTDVQARQLGQQGNWCMLRWDELEQTISLIVHQESPEVVRSIEAPEHVDIDFLSGETPVVFNAFGQSRHYGYELISEQWSSILEFNGTSGWYEVDPIE